MDGTLHLSAAEGKRVVVVVAVVVVAVVVVAVVGVAVAVVAMVAEEGMAKVVW